MLLHKLPADYIRTVLKSAFFNTALGTPLYKVAASDPKTITLSHYQKPTLRSQKAVVVKADMCGLRQPTIVIQVVDTVTLPRGSSTPPRTKLDGIVNLRTCTISPVLSRCNDSSDKGHLWPFFECMSTVHPRVMGTP